MVKKDLYEIKDKRTAAFTKDTEHKKKEFDISPSSDSEVNLHLLAKSWFSLTESVLES